MKLLTPLAATLVMAFAGQSMAANTLTVCTEASPEGFDVAQFESAVTNDASGETVYDRLMDFKRGATQVIPALAEKFEVSKDGTEYTLHLRKGVKFHTTEFFKPTRDFNADDVVFSFQRMLDKKHPWNAKAKNGFPYAEGMEFPTLIKSISKVDDLTVKIVLTKQEAPFVADLAMGFASIVSKEYADQLEKAGKFEDLNQKPIGTGPFAFKSYQKDSVVRYVANKAYWRGAPKIDNLIFAITPDPNVRVQRIKAGECQVAIQPKPDTLDSLRSDSNITVATTNALAIAYVAPNVTKKPFSDKRFRQAMWMGLDKANYAKAIYNGSASNAVAPIPPNMWSYDKGLKDQPYDPAKAAKLVKESGYDGREITIWARQGGIIDSKRAAEIMQADWSKIGIKVKVQQMEWGELLKRSGNGEHDVTFLNWFGDNGDPDNFFTPNLSCAAVEGGGNRSRWCNKAFDALLDKAKASTNVAERTKLYQQAQKLVVDDIGWIPLVYPVMPVAYRKNVTGFVQSPFGTNNFYSVSVK